MQSKATVTQPPRKPEEDPLSEGEEPRKTKENSAEEALSFFAASGTVSVPGLKQKPRIANARGRRGDDVATTTQR